MSRRSIVVQALGAFSLLLIGAVLLARFDPTAEISDRLQAPGVERSQLDRGSLGKLFRESGLVRAGRQRSLHLVEDTDVARLSFKIRVRRASLLQVFWQRQGQQFEPTEVRRLPLTRGTFHYTVGVPDLTSLQWLRIDPVDSEQRLELGELELRQPGLQSIRLSGESLRDALIPNAQLQVLGVRRGDVLFHARGSDPILTLPMARLALKPDTHTALFQKRANPDALEYVAVPGGAKNFPSVLKSQSVATGLPTLSLYLHEADLRDRHYGLLQNRQARGRQWERTGFVSYYENGELKFSSSAGIRFHGGNSRTSDESFRIYFGKKRGSIGALRNVIFNQEVRLNSLVARHTDWPVGMPLNGFLGFEVCRLVDCEIPRHRLALLYLNGKKLGLYHLSEHQSWRQWAQRDTRPIKHLYRFKSENRDADKAAFANAFIEAGIQSPRVSMERVGRIFDLDNLTANMLAQFYTANGDYCQGIAVLGDTPETARWRFVAWDMDHGFSYRPDASSIPQKPAWQEGGIEKIFAKGGACPQGELMRRLLEGDPGYREFFLLRLANVLNFELRPANMQAFIKTHVSSIEVAAVEGIDGLESRLSGFAARRADFLFDEARRLLKTGPLHRVRLSGQGLSADNLRAFVNGRQWPRGLDLRYFEGQSLEITGRLDSGDAVAWWRVNGERIDGEALQIKVSANLNIEAGF